VKSRQYRPVRRLRNESRRDLLILALEFIPARPATQSDKSSLPEVPNLREGAVLAGPVTRIIGRTMLWRRGDRGGRGEERENCLNHLP
jgi:hypothetical protein